MLALLYEYKHRKQLLKSNEPLLLSEIGEPRLLRRLRSPGLVRAAYHKEIVLAFLRAVGERDPEAVLRSFKKTGTGALHRQQVVAGSTLTNTLGAVQLIVPDPVAKVVLSVLRTVSLLVTSGAVVASGNRRLHNSGTEDVFPLGRADAAPSARRAPNVLQASWSTAGKLGGLHKDLQELTALLEQLKAPSSQPRQEPGDGAAATLPPEQLLDRLYLASAKVSHRLQAVERYRSASENAKVEWQGNKYNLMTGTFGTLNTLTASGVSILAPLMLSSVAAGAALAGATLVAALAYVAYQLSNGPEKDGEAKAQRAIIALAKLSDLLDPGWKNETEQQAHAYEAYLQALNKKGADKEAAEGELLAGLRNIAQAGAAASAGRGGDAQSRLPDENNWHRYRDYCQGRARIEKTLNGQTLEVDGLNNLKQQFFDSHAATLASKPLIDGWKTPLMIRMNAAERIAAGQTASLMKQCIELHRSMEKDVPGESTEDRGRPFPTPQSIHRLMASRHARQGKRRQEKLAAAERQLKGQLKNMVYFALARQLLKAAANEGQPDTHAPQLAPARAALANVSDGSMQALFCGDGKAQVKAMRISKEQMMGDAERYTWLNTGANAATTLLAAGVQAADLQITVDKADGIYNGPLYNDYKLVNHMQAGATPSAPLSTGDRTAIQDREIDPLRALIIPNEYPPDEHPALTMVLPVFRAAEGNGEAEAGSTEFETQLNHQIDRIVDAMAGRTFLPRTLHLQFGVRAEAGPSSSAAAPAEMAIEISLDKSKALHDMYFSHARKRDKARFIKGAVALGAKQSASVIAGLPMQAAAQVALKRSRGARNAAKAEMRKMKEALLQRPGPENHPPTAGAPNLNVEIPDATLTGMPFMQSSGAPGSLAPSTTVSKPAPPPAARPPVGQESSQTLHRPIAPAVRPEPSFTALMPDVSALSEAADFSDVWNKLRRNNWGRP